MLFIIQICSLRCYHVLNSCISNCVFNQSIQKAKRDNEPFLKNRNELFFISRFFLSKHFNLEYECSFFISAFIIFVLIYHCCMCMNRFVIFSLSFWYTHTNIYISMAFFLKKFSGRRILKHFVNLRKRNEI